MTTPISQIISATQYSREPLHPVVQLMFSSQEDDPTKRVYSADDYIVSIPPEHLMEFTAISRNGGLDEASFTFIDPSFGGLEKYIFETGKGKRSFLYRWGYPGQGLEQADWCVMTIKTYLPSVSHTGMRIVLEGLAVGSAWAYLNEPKTYKGKISTVVQAIAVDMGYKSDCIFVEETDDDANEERGQEWALGNLTRIDMITKRLLKPAKSKANPSDVYKFSCDWKRNFWFCTPTYAATRKKRSAYRQFHVLYGTPTGVISFTPRYEGAQLVPLASGVIAATFDPRTKRYEQEVLTRENLGIVDKLQETNSKLRTNAVALVKSDDPLEQRKKTNAVSYQATQQAALGGRCSGKTVQPYTEPKAALGRIENAYKLMDSLMSGGTLELYGLPEYADFDAHEQCCDIAVVLPPSVESLKIPGMIVQNGQYLHWSSGRYRIQEITHHISTGYVISVELYRSGQQEGAESSKVSKPEQTAQFEWTQVK